MQNKISLRQERVMKVLAISACALVLLTGVALAEDHDATARLEQKRQQELDAAYKAASAIKKAPTTPVDPWGVVRPANSSNTTAK
jgi:hypothetical protein